MCRYNMFNHHFFDGDKSRNVYLEFLRESTPSLTSTSLTEVDVLDRDFLVVLDPPFGGLVEVLAFTLKSISDDYLQINGGIYDSHVFLRLSYLRISWIACRTCKRKCECFNVVLG